MKHLFFLMIFMATQLGCYAQTNPKIDSLYAYLRARNLVYPYTLDNSLPWGLHKRFSAGFTFTYEAYRDKQTNDELGKILIKRWNDEYIAFKEIRKTLMELTDEATVSYSYEYHQNDADTIIMSMALKGNSDCPINTWKNPRENVKEITSAPEVISFKYHYLKGNKPRRNLHFYYDLIADSTKGGRERFDIQALKKEITPILKDKSIKRRTFVCRCDSTFNISEYQRTAPYEERFTTVFHTSSTNDSENHFTIYKFNDEERAKTVLHQVMGCVRKHINEHPTQSYIISSEDIFREHIPYSLFKGFSRKIYTDDRTSEKDNSSFCIYAYRGLEGFYILINDCKGNILAPPDWQTLKEFNNGKKVYYDKPF